MIGVGAVALALLAESLHCEASLAAAAAAAGGAAAAQLGVT